MKSVFVLLATIGAIAASVIPEGKEFRTGFENGKDASIKDWSFVASVFVKNTKEGWATKTGSAIIVNNYWVLASAFSVHDQSVEDISVRVGSIRVDRDGEVFKVCSVVNYLGFNQTMTKNDLALLRLCNPITLSQTVSFSHRSSHPSRFSDKVTVAGFGTRNLDGPLRLRSLEQKIKYFVVSEEDVNLIQTMSLESNSGPSLFDWGSPLVADGHVIGTYSIASGFDLAKRDSNTIDSFTDITTEAVWYWINETVREA